MLPKHLRQAASNRSEAPAVVSSEEQTLTGEDAAESISSRVWGRAHPTSAIHARALAAAERVAGVD